MAENGVAIISAVENDERLKTLWEEYQNKYSYAENIHYTEVI